MVNDKMKSLISVAAAYMAGGEACFAGYVMTAEATGATQAEVLEAVALARAVKLQAALSLDQLLEDPSDQVVAASSCGCGSQGCC